MPDPKSLSRDSAEEASPQAGGAGARGSGGFKAWLPLLLNLLLMPVLAYGTMRFVLIPQLNKSHGAPVAARAAHASAGEGAVGTDKITVPLTKVLVNVSGSLGTRYLLSSYTLVGTDPTFREIVEKNRDQLLDLAMSTLSTKTISDLEKPDARNLIRTELMSVFNNALGGALIQEIYITEFAIQ